MDTIQGYIDRITGLYDFNYFKYHYNEFITYHKNSKVVAFDLTDFKVINDTHGHQVGDYCLRKFGECVLEVFPDDLFVRRSGDEFYLLTDKDENEIPSLL
jgi:diguanylate cyclase (GGDEF)-like protein